MGTLIQIDKEEWDSFLEKLSELEKKYQVVLKELDAAHSRLQALDSSQKQEEKKPPTLTTPPTPTPTKMQAAQTVTASKKLGFLTQLETRLRSVRMTTTPRTGPSMLDPNAPRNYASCSRCGGKIMHATRFCERCGADFGRLVCSCGRELSSSDKFCYHCGRIMTQPS